MYIQEIEEFVQGELSYLNLSTKEKERYIKFIQKIYKYLNRYNLDIEEIKNRFIQKLEDCVEFFKMQGFGDEQSLEFAKRIVLESDRKNYKEKLAFLRVVDFEEDIITNNSLCLRFNLEKAHAKKMHLVKINDQQNQTRYLITREPDEKTEKRLNIPNIETLVKKYPLTKETTDVWMTITAMQDEEFKNYFGMTREQLSYIYPTTKEEIAVIHFIAKLTDEEIIERYGITREQLLQKYPINNDTLKALKSLNISSDRAIINTFNQPREEVLKLRTISIEMIKIAQKNRVKLQGKATNKETPKEMKKGTI